jgi:hypothetical protein
MGNLPRTGFGRPHRELALVVANGGVDVGTHYCVHIICINLRLCC